MSAQPPQAEALGYDTHFQLGNTNDFNTSNTWTDICSELIEIDPPEDAIKMIDSKYMQSPSQTEEFVPGWTNPGTCKFKAHYFYTEFAAIRAWGKAQQAFRIVYNDPTSGGSPTKSGIMFNGYRTKLKPGVNEEGLDITEGEIQLTGPSSPVASLTGIS